MTKARLPPSALTMRRIDERLARLALEAVLARADAWAGWSARKVEAGGDHGLRLALADQAAVGAGAEREAERIEQDRLAGAGLAGQHAEAGAEFEVEALDQHDVADGEAVSMTPPMARHPAEAGASGHLPCRSVTRSRLSPG